ERTFNRLGFKVGKVELNNVAYRKGSRLLWEVERRSAQQPRRGRRAKGANNLPSRVDVLTMAPRHDRFSIPALRLTIPDWRADHMTHGIARLVQDHVLDTLPVIGGWRRSGAMFLPASRTGFMLLYRSLAQQLVGDALRRVDGPRSSIPGLTAPAIDFV